MRDRICLVTGATSGIGYETALGLARAGARVGIVGRDAAKGEACRRRLAESVPGATIDLFVADLSSQAEIRRLAGEIRAAYPRLDVLVNNAGAIFDRRRTSADGYEMTWAFDHLGYVLLTLELLGLLKATGRPGASARIVNVASAAHTRGRIAFNDLGAEKSYGAMRTYSQAKLGNVLFTYALDRRLRGEAVTVNALHPGVIDTGFAKNTGGAFGFAWNLIRPFLTKPADGARTSLHVATAPALEGVSGRYFSRSRETASSRYSRDETVQERAWDVSLKQVGQKPF